MRNVYIRVFAKGCGPSDSDFITIILSIILSRVAHADCAIYFVGLKVRDLHNACFQVHRLFRKMINSQINKIII